MMLLLSMAQCYQNKAFNHFFSFISSFFLLLNYLFVTSSASSNLPDGVIDWNCGNVNFREPIAFKLP